MERAEGSTEPRVRVQATQDAKGLWKLEATAEFSSAEAATDNLVKALKMAQTKIAAAGGNLVAPFSSLVTGQG